MTVRGGGKKGRNLRKKNSIHKVTSFCVSKAEMKTLSPVGYVPSPRYHRTFTLSHTEISALLFHLNWYALSNFFKAVSVIAQEDKTACLLPVR